MKKSIPNKLLVYSGAASAFLAFGNKSDAQVVHIDIDPDTMLNSALWETYEIDFNNDATQEFEIRTQYTTISFSSVIYTTYSAGIFEGNPAFGIIGGAGGVDALDFNNPIKQNSVFNAGIYAWNLGYHGFGNFAEEGDKYIGVKFSIGANIHYGWILVNLNSNCSEMVVKAFGYEFQPDVGVLAGDIVGIYVNLLNVDNILTTSADVHFWPSKSGNVYYVVQNASDPVPTKAEVISGTGAAGATFVQDGYKGVSNVPDVFNLTALPSGANLKLYAVFVHASEIESSVKEISFTTVLNQIEKENLAEFKLYPSIVESVIQLELNSDGVITIIDASGKTMISFDAEAGNHHLDMSHFSSGMYFVKFNNFTEEEVKKFIKR